MDSRENAVVSARFYSGRFGFVAELSEVRLDPGPPGQIQLNRIVEQLNLLTTDPTDSTLRIEVASKTLGLRYGLS